MREHSSKIFYKMHYVKRVKWYIDNVIYDYKKEFSNE